MKGWVKLLIAIAQLLVLALVFYAGTVWCAHRHDGATIKAQTSQLVATQKALGDTQRDWRQALAQFRVDSNALGAIAQEYAHDHEARTKYFWMLDDRLVHALAARPDLAACDIGPDGLRIWNDANRGAPTAGVEPTAAAENRPGAVAAVPGLAAGPLWQIVGPGTQSPESDGGLSRLREPARAHDRIGEGARSDRSGPRGASGGSGNAGRVALNRAPAEGTP